MSPLGKSQQQQPGSPLSATVAAAAARWRSSNCGIFPSAACSCCESETPSSTSSSSMCSCSSCIYTSCVSLRRLRIREGTSLRSPLSCPLCLPLICAATCAADVAAAAAVAAGATKTRPPSCRPSAASSERSCKAGRRPLPSLYRMTLCGVCCCCCCSHKKAARMSIRTAAAEGLQSLRSCCC